MNNKILQNAILKVGKEIHKICIENDIKYSIYGGTLLGAIRHKGFIPWDDDMDFCMTWDNYQKFISVVSNLNHPWLVFDVPSETNTSYGKLFIKAYDKNTTFIEWDKNEEAKGVFVDIFPIVYGGNTKEETIKIWKKYQYIRALMDRKYYILHPEFSLKDRVLRILSKMYSHECLIKKARDLYNHANAEKRQYSLSYDGPKREIVKSEYYETPFVLYPFEDTFFYGIADYDSWLTDVYADYMQFPPQEMQVPGHYKFADLSLPFEEYNKKRQR